VIKCEELRGAGVSHLLELEKGMDENVESPVMIHHEDTIGGSDSSEHLMALAT